MANVYGTNMWKLDTVHSAAIVDKIKIKRMEWVPNASGDDLIVVDKNADEIWRVDNAIAGGNPGKEVFEADGLWFEGFKLSTIGGGTLYVWFM